MNRFEFRSLFRPSPLSPETPCPECGSPSRRRRDSDTPLLCDACVDAHQQADEAERLRRVRLGAIRASGIPQRILHFECRNKFLRARAVNGSSGVYLCGRTGSGKSVLAGQIGIAFIDAGRSARFVTANRLISEAQATYSNRSETSPLLFSDNLARLDVLIVDDLGREKLTDDARRILFGIFDDRIARSRKTVFTSERNIEEIGQMFDEAFVGRIVENCEIVNLGDENLRFRSNGNETGS